MSSAAIVCLASAIGAATAVFSIVDGVVLRSLPFANADRLMAIWGVDPGRDTVLRGFSWLDAQDIARQNRSLEDLAVVENANGGMTLTGRGDPAQLPSRTASGNFFDVLGVRAAMGRPLTTRDDDVASVPVVVLSDALWRERFGRENDRGMTPTTMNGRPSSVRAAPTMDGSLDTTWQETAAVQTNASATGSPPEVSLRSCSFPAWHRAPGEM